MKHKKLTFVILSFLFVIGFYLRVLYLPQNALTFGYDQARDAFVARQIISGDLKILGPPASTPGLYHGVFYYYFLAPAYAISHNPIVAAYWTAFFNASTIPSTPKYTFAETNLSLIVFKGVFNSRTSQSKYLSNLSEISSPHRPNF